MLNKIDDTVNAPISPHGGTLVNRILNGKERENVIEKAKQLKKITLNAREVSDLELLSTGGFSPLAGFMNKTEYDSILKNMRLSNGLAWTIPVTLSVIEETAKSLKLDEQVSLYDTSDNLFATMIVEDIYKYDKLKEAQCVYGTEEDAHPGVAALYAQKETLIGGTVSVVAKISHPDFPELRFEPSETRKIFRERGWKRVVAFQTRNPVHRAHEYIQKCALEIMDGLLLHPLVGETKSGDISAEVRIQCYKALLDGYYPKDRVLLSLLPAAMRYAGPKEAIFHSIMRLNYGCTHFIVGRDHAGVGNYYGTFDAQKIFGNFTKEELAITPLFFDNTFYCKTCGNMSSIKTCPHSQEHHLILSGTKVREMLQRGDHLPEEFTRPEVAEILIKSFDK